MSLFATAVGATAAIDAVELGAIVFIARRLWNERTEMRLLSFAAGVLLATIFLDLLPEATTRSDNDRAVCVAVLAAMIGLFMLERLLQRDHADTHTHTPTHKRPTPPDISSSSAMEFTAPSTGSRSRPRSSPTSRSG